MSLTIEKSNRNFEDKDGRQVQVNEGICKVRLHGEYIGAVAQTNYYNDSPSRWKVWEWKSKEDEFKFKNGSYEVADAVGLGLNVDKEIFQRKYSHNEEKIVL